MAEIVDLRHMADAIRNTGYKDLDSAVAEIVDNSIEANANDIFIILCEETNERKGRKVVNEIGFLDNGSGMNDKILEKCLGIGSSTRQERKGIGRFGVGLPQASLYASPCVEVYSWQNGVENSKKVFLDTEKMSKGEQVEIEPPVACKLPKPYSEFITYKTQEKNYDFSKNGTLVVWKKCDNLNPRSRLAIKDTLQESLGQKFRYFIHNKTCEIRIFCEQDRDIKGIVYPNDPLFLMDDNCILGNPDFPDKAFHCYDSEKTNLEPVFEPYKANGNNTGIVPLSIRFMDKKGEEHTENVEIKFSIVKSKFYDATAFPGGKNPGSYPIGKHAKKLEGISVVRAGREIDFRKFDFFENVNEPQHRWWGCEISFSPALDEAFKVANNKQYVELKKTQEKEFQDDDELPSVWEQLNKIIKPTIDDMYKQNENIRERMRSSSMAESVFSSASEDTIDSVEENNTEDSISENIKNNSDPAELVEKVKEVLEENNVIENPTDEDAKQWLKMKLKFIYKAQIGQSNFFSMDFSLGNVTVYINTNHEFYKTYLSKAISDASFKTAFELLLASYAKSVDDLRHQQKENDRLHSKWQSKLLDYIDRLQNPITE